MVNRTVLSELKIAWINCAMLHLYSVLSICKHSGVNYCHSGSFIVHISTSFINRISNFSKSLKSKHSWNQLSTIKKFPFKKFFIFFQKWLFHSTLVLFTYTIKIQIILEKVLNFETILEPNFLNMEKYSPLFKFSLIGH